MYIYIYILGRDTNLLQNLKVFSEFKTKSKQPCVMVIRKMLVKLRGKSPLNYSIVRCTASLSPANMMQN